MSVAAIVTIAVVAVVIGVLVFTRYPADVVFLGGLTLLMVIPVPDPAGWRLGVLTVEEALAGLSNPGPVTVGVLFVVVAGLRETGALDWIAHHLLGRPKSIVAAQLRIMAPVVAMSAFLNNTPVVAMMIPVVDDWARKMRFSVSKLMLPLSYAAILGGTCTLIGTSTNLVVNGLLLSQTDLRPLGMFELAWIGVPCALVGVLYVLLGSRRLLPDRTSIMSQLDNPREYSVEMLVEPKSPLAGKTIEEAGLRHLPGMYLVEIERGTSTLPAVAPTERLQENDRLVFVGIVESVKDLQKIRGLQPATDQVFKIDARRTQRCLIEAVVSNTCPLVGKTIRDGKFRTVYNAAVIAVARNGERIRAKIGDIVLRAGDTLLLHGNPQLVEQHRNSRDFFLLSRVEDSAPLRHEKAWIAVLILFAMVAVVAFGWLSMLTAAMLAAGMMIFSRACTATAARRSVDWQVIVVIAAALGIGAAIDKSGAAHVLAEHLMALAGSRPWIALAIVYVLTSFFTEIITNNAAAALVFPIALATARELGVHFEPFAIAIMIAASASFATPLGYQTNLMVLGPGGYRFGDYLRFGLPMNLIIGATTILLVPLIWPF